MQINPGGRLNTRDVVGRDNEIARYWRVLERQGLVISAERRIGKTHIVLKMRDECRSGFLPFYMLSLTVPPMAQEDTCGLAAALLEETRADAAQIPELASRIAGEVGGFPYYIHHVVDQLDQLRRPPALEDVSSAVDTLVYDPHDPANLNYYVTRLSSYYADDERSLALVVLDTMAGQATPTPVGELLNLCKHRDPSLADEQLREILTALAEDHYIEPTKQVGGAAYDFRWQLVKKWWKERRS